MESKLKSEKAIIQISNNLRREGKKIVTINGSFDLLHAGHLDTLLKAKSKGDCLMVLLNSDNSVRAYKGPGRPIFGQRERAFMLGGLSAVDYVAIFEELVPNRLLALIKPHVHVNTSDWGSYCVERETVEKNGGKLVVLPKIPNLSTTNVITSVLHAYEKPAPRAIFLDRDDTINRDTEFGYINKIEDFRFIPGSLDAMARFAKTDYKIIIVTNQSGIGRGHIKKSQLENLHRWMVGAIEKRGGRIDKIYHCPHHPDHGCACRKPGTAMVMRAVKDLGISLNDSWLVGNSGSDIALGRATNLKSIKIGARINSPYLQPNFYAKNLLHASHIILKA